MPSWIFKFLVSFLRLLVSIPDACIPSTKAMVHGPWTKSRMFALTTRTETRDSKIQDGGDVDVLKSPEPDIEQFSALSCRLLPVVV